ncbi:competence protein CoiA [Cyclobacterium marinum]|uniref:competence protein CoiA n=1 Tax=Cyclobacterium marinum TaxID=104 RepID=UPI0011EF4514|nr:competence protein CoiA family protein [Cyclobacterium marinum]MBI0397795.1 competence protein [Cyclobacterium marinum]
MQFALVNGNRTKPRKGVKGICPGCLQPVIPKCGEQRIHHWAHIGDFVCNAFREAETEWHLSWKNNFPLSWQERRLADNRTGEIHIADICTDKDFIIEFQHSSITSEERNSREEFHKEMIWVVDGTCQKRTYPRFLKRIGEFSKTNKQGHYSTNDFPESYFPERWVKSKVPVIFDFKGTQEISNYKDFRNNLIMLFPSSGMRETIIAVLSRESFIGTINSDGRLFKPIEPKPEKTKKAAKKRTIQTSPYYYDSRKGRFIKKRRF